MRTAVDRAVASYRRFIEPATTGLPGWRVVAWFPVAALLLAVVLIALQVSGTSSGMHWQALGTGPDPRLIFGIPRGIRSDEWLVYQSWLVSQAENGFPSINPTFPGGIDVTVLNELPSWDWSTIFRPHLWGHLLFGIDVGIAWQWWLPGVALVSACYVMLVSFLPRRPLFAALIATGVWFVPLMQWWYGASTIFPVTFAFIVVGASVWLFRDNRLWVRVTWAVLMGYCATVTGMGLYVPFILPCVLLAAAFVIGYLFRERPWAKGGWRATAHRLLPFLAAAAGAIAVVAAWALTRRETFEAIMSTVYPGQRTQPTGQLLAKDPYLLELGGAPWADALKGIDGRLLGDNPSEASSVFLLALFLVPALIWFVVRSIRRRTPVDPVLIAMIAVTIVILAYLLVPGWDSIARLLFLHLTSVERTRIFFVAALPIFVMLIVDQVDRNPDKRNWAVGVVCGAFAMAFMGFLAWELAVNDPAVLRSASAWAVVAAFVAVATVMVFFRRLAAVAAALLLIATVLTTGNVNPIYRGVFDLRATEIGQTIERIDDDEPGAWVGVGSYETFALLVESGVESFSGVQTYPPKEMWERIDPKDRFEQNWNRLAHVMWHFGAGEPRPENPRPDVIQTNFDGCSDFAQEHVSYVLSDDGTSATPCLNTIAVVQQGAIQLTVYEVVPEAMP